VRNRREQFLFTFSLICGIKKIVEPYYFGDGVNAYLLENKDSVLSFMGSIYENKTGKKAFDLTPAIQLAASMVGNDEYKVWDEKRQ
jgi:hypothetical protein